VDVGDMMKVAIYPGSFNPWHEGHHDIVTKALQVFDKIVIAQGVNPDKKFSDVKIPAIHSYGEFSDKVQVVKFRGLLVDLIIAHPEWEICANVRGLRNSNDLLFEQTQQYWNERLGIKVPTVYFVCAKDLVDISSSAIRIVEALRGNNKSDS
jgi:pantetheine-phosphate adenylyltransferase